MPIKKILNSIEKSRRKKAVIRRILNSKQNNIGVSNIHRLDTTNIGDYYCAPHHYFKELQNTGLDIFDYKKQDDEVRSNFVEKTCNNSLIIGGGGLLNRGGFKRQMKLFESLTETPKKIVLWGVGHNEKHPKTYGKVKNYNVDVNKFGMAGTRDKNMPGEYVPCVSCMHSLFDQTYTETQEIGVIFHKDTVKKDKIVSQFKDYPSTSNTTNLKEIIEFIGASKCIITDSYHAMYWGILLEKKVVVIPNSSKFYDFHKQPVFSTFNDAIKDSKKAESYSGVLDECREINQNFANKTFDYLNL
ncbi:glycosyltransferase family protein [Psychroflexus aestuariivivens]|uniref:hypothetical protein n=1 Tax=Psychroflexus aestuariivivens TaxID=1795040 RepID=UPI000FD85F08|nr:hypothetical protein [Psychroflexus aestuariivivens]